MGKRLGGSIGRAAEGDDDRTHFLNPKHEARISKQARMSKIQNSKQFCLRFKILNLGFVSDLEIRISDF
jgi:hypothetical protein